MPWPLRWNPLPRTLRWDPLPRPLRWDPLPWYLRWVYLLWSLGWDPLPCLDSLRPSHVEVGWREVELVVGSWML